MRYTTLDIIRGITLISMVLYHLVWDLVFIYGMNLKWYQSDLGYVWQQSICWTFILLSGFCWSMGKKKWKRGFVVFAAGFLITVVTVIFMPQQKVVFGVLTMLGSCMLLLIPFEKMLVKIPAFAGLIVSGVGFFLMRNVSRGYLGFERIRLWKLPGSLYRDSFTTYLGFPEPGFFSTDYFPLFPWVFLFLCGYFLYRVAKEKDCLLHLTKVRAGGLELIGRHSLKIYMLHQPIIYFILYGVQFIGFIEK